MRLGYKQIRLLELIVIFLMVGISFYSFLKNKVYHLTSSALQQILFTLLPLEVHRELTLALLIAVIAPLLHLYSKGREKHMDGIYAILWLMHLPSVLYYSGLDWLEAISAQLNFQVFETELSLGNTLLIGAILVGGRILLFLTSNIRKTLEELQKRGADEDDLMKVSSGMTFFALTIVTFSISMALLMSYIIPMIKALLNPFTGMVPYTYAVVGTASLIAIPVIAILYLYSRARF